MNHQDIKKVHVVYKTHLDVGFTDMGQNVLDRYVNEHIPHAINLALEMNTPEHKKFIWTVGSFLIDYYQKHASKEAIQKMDEAIEKGYFCWHALACTTHTELMSQRLFDYDLKISQKLDQKYHTKTIAAKMTDVPGHTISILKPMSKAGIQYLHIGVNASSMVPQIPEVFVWKYQGNEMIVHYSSEYGKPLSIDGFDQALEFAHTGDNLGPQSAQEVEAEFERIQALYPNATVEASTLDQFAACLMEIKDQLPVIEEEIADTWIHGVGSDPWKISRYKELLRLMDRWLEEGLITEDSEAYDHFMMNLMLIPEHTWGLDFKKYLADFQNWTKEDFQKARKEDTTTLDFLTNRNACMLEVLKSDFEKYRGGVFTGSYSYFESAHQEQREYLNLALQKLPEALKQQAQTAMQQLTPAIITEGTHDISYGRTIQINGWSIRLNGFGAISFLEKDNHCWIHDGEAARLQYEIFDINNCNEAYYHYNRDFMTTQCWSEGDFSKPGLEYVEDLRQTCYNFTACDLFRVDNTIVVTLISDEEASEKFGCPRKAQILYTLEKDKITCQLNWFDKDANKIPEAIWFKFQFDVQNPNRWMIRKLGENISPLNVVRGGNRKQHCAESLIYSGADGQIEIKNIHSPLVSVGARNLYSMNHQFDDLSGGFYFNLFNNRWGTNFKMWCEDDCSFTYEIRIKSN